MKKIFSVAILFATHLLWAQGGNDKTFFLDSLGNPATAEKHDFIRIIKDYYGPEQSTYQNLEYYKSGVLKKEYQTLILNDAPAKIISQTEYYPTGKKKRDYKTDAEKNTYTSIIWFENGKLKSEETTNSTTEITLLTTYYENGQKRAVEQIRTSKTDPFAGRRIIHLWNLKNQQVVKNGNGTYFMEDGTEKISGTIKDSIKQGTWKIENKINGQVSMEEYEKGKFIMGKNTDPDGSTVAYTEIERFASPKEGIKKFNEYITKHFKYPINDSFNGIEGEIKVEFKIDKEGKIFDARILKGVSHSLDREALRVINSSPNWIPATLRGRKVKCKLVLPIYARSN